MEVSQEATPIKFSNLEPATDEKVDPTLLSHYKEKLSKFSKDIKAVLSSMTRNEPKIHHLEHLLEFLEFELGPSFFYNLLCLVSKLSKSNNKELSNAPLLERAGKQVEAFVRDSTEDFAVELVSEAFGAVSKLLSENASLVLRLMDKRSFQAMNTLLRSYAFNKSTVLTFRGIPFPRFPCYNTIVVRNKKLKAINANTSMEVICTAIMADKSLSEDQKKIEVLKLEPQIHFLKEDEEGELCEMTPETTATATTTTASTTVAVEPEAAEKMDTEDSSEEMNTGGESSHPPQATPTTPSPTSPTPSSTSKNAKPVPDGGYISLRDIIALQFTVLVLFGAVKPAAGIILKILFVDSMDGSIITSIGEQTIASVCGNVFNEEFFYEDKFEMVTRQFPFLFLFGTENKANSNKCQFIRGERTAEVVIEPICVAGYTLECRPGGHAVDGKMMGYACALLKNYRCGLCNACFQQHYKVNLYKQETINSHKPTSIKQMFYGKDKEEIKDTMISPVCDVLLPDDLQLNLVEEFVKNELGKPPVLQSANLSSTTCHNPTAPASPARKDPPLAGKTFSLSGNLGVCTQGKLEEIIVAAGGRVADNGEWHITSFSGAKRLWKEAEEAEKGRES